MEVTYESSRETCRVKKPLAPYKRQRRQERIDKDGARSIERCGEKSLESVLCRVTVGEVEGKAPARLYAEERGVGHIQAVATRFAECED